jgi:hypothetical protein
MIHSQWLIGLIGLMGMFGLLRLIGLDEYRLGPAQA